MKKIILILILIYLETNNCKAAFLDFTALQRGEEAGKNARIMEMQQMQLLEIHQQKLAIERYEFEQKILQTEAQAKAQQQQTERVSRDAKIYNSVMVPALQRAAEFEEKTQVKNTQKGHKK